MLIVRIRSRVLVGRLSAAMALGVCGVGASPEQSFGADPTPRAPVLAGLNLDQANIPDMQAAMRRGHFSSERLTRFYINRIWRVDPLLRSVITVNPDAIDQAVKADWRRVSHRSRGVLDGIPVLLKDNVDTADDQPTTAGSLALLQTAPTRDAEVVSRLRQSGAVILGKANLSEWANFRSTQSISGWSGVRGQTNNPYVLDRNPCGSSSGSAVAVAASLAAVAVGTETWGSIMCPAGASGVVGVKPTVGLVSRAGIVPISPAQDTAGPFARNVTDAAITLSAMQGIDSRDPATADAAAFVRRDYRRALDARALRGKRIGLYRNAEGPEVSRVLDEAAAAMRRAGATVVDTVLDETPLYDPGFRVLLTEFKPAVNAYLAQTPGSHPGSLAGLIDFNRRFAAQEMPLFGQEIFEMSEATSGVADPAYLADRRFVTDTARRTIDDTLREQDLDAIAGPTNSPAWMTTGETTSCTDFGDTATFAALAGYPNVTVPAGFACGELPLNISFFGGRFSEPLMLSLAYAFEQETHARRPPKFLPTLPAAQPITPATSASEGAARVPAGR